MKNYIVRVTETLVRDWIISAENEEEAFDKLAKAYDNEEINLDYDDYDGYELEVLREAKERDLRYYDILEDDE